ncbi:hypothetical protein GY45DRAFT_418633 [Cubamyces sp. BRFM 1775]|nr:hypothetical protein GY45DRAFT_418633 [Cubamyces sp. BRFM 1775]
MSLAAVLCVLRCMYVSLNSALCLSVCRPVVVVVVTSIVSYPTSSLRIHRTSTSKTSVSTEVAHNNHSHDIKRGSPLRTLRLLAAIWYWIPPSSTLKRLCSITPRCLLFC